MTDQSNKNILDSMDKTFLDRIFQILCILTHLNIKKTAKMCYSKHGIYHWKFNKYHLSDNGVQNLIFSGQYIIIYIEQK